MATKKELIKQLAAKGEGGTLSPTNIIIPMPPRNPAYADMGDIDPHELEQMNVATWDEEKQAHSFAAPRVWYVIPRGEFVLEAQAAALTSGRPPQYSRNQVVEIKDAAHMAKIDSRMVVAYNAFVANNQVKTTETITEEASFKKEDAQSPDEWADKLSQAGVPRGTLFKFAGRIYKVKPAALRGKQQASSAHETFDDPHPEDHSDVVIF